METVTRRHFRDYDPDDESGFETGEYWARRDAAVEARIAADIAFAATPQGRREALQRKLDAMRFARHDHGAYSDAELAAVEAELDALQPAPVVPPDPDRQTRIVPTSVSEVVMHSPKGSLPLRWDGRQLVSFGRQARPLRLTPAKTAELAAALLTGETVWIGRQDIVS